MSRHDFSPSLRRRLHAWHARHSTPLLHVAKLVLLALPALLLIRGFVFGNDGYLALRQRQARYQVEAARLQRTEDENRALQQTVRELKTPAAVEAIAREQLHLTKPGELILTYTDSKAH